MGVGNSGESARRIARKHLPAMRKRLLIERNPHREVSSEKKSE